MENFVWGGPDPRPSPGTRAYLHRHVDNIPHAFVRVVGEVVAHWRDTKIDDVTLRVDNTLLHLNMDEIFYEKAIQRTELLYTDIYRSPRKEKRLSHILRPGNDRATLCGRQLREFDSNRKGSEPRFPVCSRCKAIQERRSYPWRRS